MGELPRKIPEGKIIRFVFIQNLGIISVKDKEDKERIIALGEIYLEEFNKGYIFINDDGGLPNFKGEAPKKYKNSLQVLMSHGMKNMYLLEKYPFLEKEIERLLKLKLKMVFLKKEVFFSKYKV